jgi:pyrimidine-nucleoside phosphorylase
VQAIDTETIGHASMLLGAGRARLDSAIDHGVGLIVQARIGDSVNKESALVRLHFNDEARVEEAAGLVTRAYAIGPERIEPPALIKAVLR